MEPSKYLISESAFRKLKMYAQNRIDETAGIEIFQLVPSFSEIM